MVPTEFQLYGFTGLEFDVESGLHQNWMRDYDPTTGRYIQADPLGLVDGSSVFGYALQSPYRYTDPMGMEIFDCTTVGGVGGFGEIGYEDGDFYGGSRKTCMYQCTSRLTNQTKTFMSCSDDMSLGDQCHGTWWKVRSTGDGGETTMKSSPFPNSWVHDSDMSWWDRLTDPDLSDFNDDIIEVFE